MSPHALADMVDSDSGSEPQLVNGQNTGWSSPASNDSATTEVSDIASEPIAIVGMGCRLPGDVRSASDLWDFLSQHRSGQGEVPSTRWNIDSFYHPNGNDKAGSMNMRGGYFIKEDLRNFENDFFGINNLEATFMDPQQRKLLEVVFECLESAGITLEDVSGANVGTYVGSFTTDFWIMQARDPEYWNRYNATGMGTTILANRISHIFNLKGPSFVLDTACSSSLYGLHLACAALDAGECDSAIVAAANLIQSPEQHIGTMKAGVLSATGTCHTFDDSADGYGRADGVGAIYLKKLSKAIADGDPIRSIVRGTAVNSNGRTQGITLPSANGQEAVIRKAYQKAGLSDKLSHTNYIECHGTGTPVGDPIEVEAVSRVFRQNKSEAQPPLLLGSVKTSLGHSEAASGISSIIKATLALENGSIPATVGVKNINPKIKLDEWGIQIATQHTEFPKSSAVTPSGALTKRLGINSFGYGGANSHAILDSAEGYVPLPTGESSEILSLARSKFLIPLSASSNDALDMQAHNLASWHVDRIHAVDLAHTLGTRRSKLTQRGFALVGQNTMAEDLLPAKVKKTSMGSFSQLPIAFVFTGQGAQWPQMGKELIEEFPSFRRSIQDLDAVLQTLPEEPSWTLQQAILDPIESSQISHVTRSQPVCTAIQVAYVQLLSKWDIKPVGVIGHSSGEIGAAYAAGRLTAAQAIVVAYYRGYVVGKSKSPTSGGMMAAGLSKEAGDAEIERLNLDGIIRVACVNSPESVTISGDAIGIDKILAELQARGVFARKLNTDGRAYHSHHMSLIGEEYQDLLEKGLDALPPAKTIKGIRWISSVYAREVTGKVFASYWRKNLESPVLFSDAVEALVKDRKLHLVEVGPHSALEMPIKQTRTTLGLTDSDVHYSASLSRGKNAVECALNLIGNLYLHGHDVNFATVNHVETTSPSSSLSGPQGKVLTNLPPYAWTYDGVLWNESRASEEFRHRKYPKHDLLGSQNLGADGHTTQWRNILKAKDIPWVQGHKLGQDIVFPGAGYLAMAVEAICQATGKTKADDPTFTLRNVSISKALPLSMDANIEGIEVFTSLTPSKLTGSVHSKSWYDFAVMSYNNAKSVIHAQGMISIEKNGTIKPRHASENIDLGPLATRNWYDRFQKVGLNFGETFQTMKKIETHHKKQIMHCRSEVPYLQGGGEGKSNQSDYIIHPITIDTIFQSAIIASSAGIMKDLTCKVPVMIESARFKAPKANEEGQLWTVDAVSQPIGFSAILIAGEIHDGKGQTCAQVENVTAVTFNGAGQEVIDDERHPMLRVTWKPDVSKLTSSNIDHFCTYINATGAANESQFSEPSVRRLAVMVDLLTHKDPRVRILELGQPFTPITKYLLGLLGADSAFKRYGSYSRGFVSENDALMVQDETSVETVTETLDKVKVASDKSYDLIILNAQGAEQYGINGMQSLKYLISDGGAMVGLMPADAGLTIEAMDFPVVSLPLEGSPVKIAFAKHIEESKKKPKKHHIILVEREGNETFNDVLVPQLSKHFGQDIERIYLHKLLPQTIKPKATVVTTVELHHAILSGLTDAENINVKAMTDNATNLIWLTGGDNMNGGKPNMSLVSGLSRALMLEQPSLRFFTLDIDRPDVDVALSIRNVITVVEEAHTIEMLDFESVQHRGLVHTSRFVPEETMNATFRQKQTEQAVSRPLGESKPSHLMIQSVGQFETLSFKQTVARSGDLMENYVEVEIKSIGLNPKDVSFFSGRLESKGTTSSSECAGVVTKVGDKVLSLKAGDRVVVMAPGRFATVEAFPEWTCEKLEDNEDFDVASIMPTAFSTALYAFRDRAKILGGKTVLIHHGATDIGIAAIQIAQLEGAEVFATVDDWEEHDFLTTNYGVYRENIFGSRDSSFLPAVLSVTDNRGVDIVLNTLTGELFKDSAKCCAEFGTFIDISRRDLTEAAKTDTHTLPRNATFTAFDLNDLYDEADTGLQIIWQGLLKDVMALYRGGKIQAFTPLIFEASEVSNAFKTASAQGRASKIAISFKDDSSLIKVLPLKYDTALSPEKTYLMIGCLGGLGRSMSKWMIKQGAQKFVFLGRSGTDRPPARKLVEDLEASGAQVQVMRGDVGVYSDVQRCVDVIDGEIGGVIQAAMGLNEALWTSMPNEFWHSGIDPKVIGTWNLHHAIAPKASSLEFFLMTSSISGSVGTATESNYCAANYFLDVFARHRRAYSLPATSVGLGMISEVGYLHENPEIEALLLRKGIQAINEDELLQIIDCALSQPRATSSIPSTDTLSAAHILTGLEPHGIKRMRAQGFDGTNPTLNDPRASLLASSLDGEGDSALKSNSGLPTELAAALDANEGGETSILPTIVGLISKRFSNLVLVPVEKIDPAKPLVKFGMDSMLAAEFRTWFYQAFRVDVPFLTLLSEQVTLGSLGELVESDVLEVQEG